MTGPGPEIRSVIVERTLPCTPEKLWRALTLPHLIEEWLMKNDFKPVAGHRFNLSNQPQPGMTVVIDCEVLEIEPPKILSYTWKAYGLDSSVTFTLTPTATGTHLRMEQSGFRPDQTAAFYGARAGWTQFIKSLEQLVARAE